eukprot:2570089-Amphidinium_carterae.4
MAVGGWHELAPKYWDEILDKATKSYWYWSALSPNDRVAYESQLGLNMSGLTPSVPSSSKLMIQQY